MSGDVVVVRPLAPGRVARFLLLLAALAALSSVEPLLAQATMRRDPTRALTQYRIDTWQTEQGLPLNTVQCLLQTRDGYLWVGTGGGLARFDGVRFTTFESTGIREITSQGIFGLFEDAQGTLWIGVSGEAYRYRDGRFTPAFGADAVEGRRVWSFAQAADGSIWSATENGLIHWSNGRATLFGKESGLPTIRLRSVAIDRDGTLWIATGDEGLVSFDGSRFTSFSPTNGFPHRAVRSVLADPEGGVWAATAGGGLALVREGKITTWGPADGLSEQLTSLSRDTHGSLWIGTWGDGLYRMHEGRFSSISTSQGLAGSQLWSVHADREGNVWAGTWVGGLNRLRERDFLVLGTPEGLSHDNVRAVLQARDGAMWVTTSGGGVNRITPDAITTIRMAQGLPSDEASTILEASDGSIWIGTYTAGVARLRDGKLERFGLAEGLPNVDVRCLYEDRDGTIWAGSMSGLATFDGSRFRPITDPGAPPQGASAMLHDRDGTFWFGMNEGLVRYRDGRFETLTREHGLVSNWIMSLHQDADGTIWIGTNGEGMNRLKDGRLTAIRPADGLWDGTIQVILEDHFGNFWITCNRGFFRVSKAELNAFCDGRVAQVSSTSYGPGDALRSTTFAGGLQPAGTVDANGHLWLPSFSGLVVVEPADLPGSGEPPAVRIERVTVDGQEVPFDRKIVLPPGSAPLAIYYTSTTLRVAEKVRFRYRLEGAGGGWVDTGRNREAFFPALSHGTYRFLVASTIDGERWREIASPLTIVVRPSLVHTPWFLPLLTFILIAVTFGGLRLRTRSLQRQKAEMERLVAEKTEELRLANEHLARLSFADPLTGLANRRRFDETLEQEWQRARRFGTPIAVVLADVDFFKPYNDALGHPAGDLCLKMIAEVLLQSSRRATDLVARYGGEEFVVLIPGCDRDAAVAFASQLRASCEARGLPHPRSSVAPVVTITLGVASRVPTPDTSWQMLIADADAALYRAKREGRNRVGS